MFCLGNNIGKKFKRELVVVYQLIPVGASQCTLIFLSECNDLIIVQVSVCFSLCCKLIMIHFIVRERFRS